MTDLPHSSVQAHTAKPVHRQPTTFAPVPQAARFPLHLPAPMLELCVVLAMCCLLLVAMFAPAVAQPEAYHRFADDRAWVGVPFAMDVLSNAAFVAGGAWGLWRLGSLGNLGSRALSAPVWVTAVVFFGGLLFTGMGSAVYHWQPEGGGLMVDRAAMSVAFAGLLGLAVADRVSGRAAMWVTCVMLVWAPVAAALAWRGDNALPWLVLQMGGLLLLLALAAVAPKARTDGGVGGLPLLGVVAIYGLAKVFELADHAVFDLTQGWVSGHTLKHVVAACVVFPLMRGLGGGAATAGRMRHRLAQAEAPHGVRVRAAQPFNRICSRICSRTTAQVRPS